MGNVSACIVMTSVSDQEQAEKMAKAVLEARLAACVQIQEITSHYWWNGKINKDAEQLVCFKTSADKYEALQKAIVANHTYDTPAILQVPVVAGFEKYLGWIGREVRRRYGRFDWLGATTMTYPNGFKIFTSSAWTNSLPQIT